MNLFVDNLHANGQRYGNIKTDITITSSTMSCSHTVVIVDAGIKNEIGYPAYDQGLLSNSFIKVSERDTVYLALIAAVFSSGQKWRCVHWEGVAWVYRLRRLYELRHSPILAKSGQQEQL